MPAYHFPILVWEDYSGYFTARLVEDMEAPATFAATASEAMFQIKELVEWSFQKYPWRETPDFNDPKLVRIRVEIRPEYQLDERVFPVESPLVLRLPCVYGRNSNGLLICSLPTIGARFYYQEAGKLKDMVAHYAQEALRGKTPRALSRFLAPREARLENVVVHVNRKDKRSIHSPKIETLEISAEPLGDKKLRRQFSRAWEREDEVASLVSRIRSERSNVIIVGEPGSGKTSALIEAARQIERLMDQDGDPDPGEANLSRHKFWLTSGARLIAGMRYLGQWQERCEQIISELSEIGGVLCLDNLLDLIKTGSGSVEESLAAFLLPYLQRGELRVIAEATPAELDACRRLLPGLVDVFQILTLHPFRRAEAINVLSRIGANHSRNLRISIPEETTSTIYRLFRRFMPYQAFPGKTVSFLNEMAENAVRTGAGAITPSEAITRFAQQSGLPEHFLHDERPLDYAETLAAFQRQVIGQEAACEAAANLVMTFKAGLNDPARPLGVLLFCGPTGVGKTEMARALSAFFFGHGGQKDRLVRLDMSESSNPGAAIRLFTSAGGEPSELIKRVRQQPFCVVLLDEIEKADYEVFDVLLSVFDEGRLTDRFGRVTTFRSAVIIMTSNLGADKLQNVGFESKGAPSYSRSAMNFFRPEFFNRIDAIIQFNSLSTEMMRLITEKELGEISAREGMINNNIRLQWTDELKDHLISIGFDQRYGARPLQRTIESFVVAPLARRLLADRELKDVTLRISVNGEKQLIIDN